MKTKLNLIAILTLILGLNLYAQTFTVDSKDGRNQATFVSEAPFEKIVGVSSGLDATVMISTTNITKKPMGKVKVAISNIKTGIGLRDKHLVSEHWLYAEKYPTAEFQLTAIKNPTAKTLENGKKVKATFVGKFSVHGVTKEVEAPGELTYFKESGQTKAKAPGNLLVTRANFIIKLSDYGVTIPSMVVGKLSEDVNVSVDFVASDSNGGANPCGGCNPCGAKANKGKCNPCGMKDGDKKGNPCAMKDNPCNPCAPKKK